jgi:hypothetical protein
MQLQRHGPTRRLMKIRKLGDVGVVPVSQSQNCESTLTTVQSIGFGAAAYAETLQHLPARHYPSTKGS